MKLNFVTLMLATAVFTGCAGGVNGIKERAIVAATAALSRETVGIGGLVATDTQIAWGIFHFHNPPNYTRVVHRYKLWVEADSTYVGDFGPGELKTWQAYSYADTTVNPPRNLGPFGDHPLIVVVYSMVGGEEMPMRRFDTTFHISDVSGGYGITHGFGWEVDVYPDRVITQW